MPEIDYTTLLIDHRRNARQAEAIYAVDALRGLRRAARTLPVAPCWLLASRDTRKIDALYNLTGKAGCSRTGPVRRDAIGIFPSSSTVTHRNPATTGRHWQVPYRALVPKGVGNSSAAKAASALLAGPTLRRAT